MFSKLKLSVSESFSLVIEYSYMIGTLIAQLAEVAILVIVLAWLCLIFASSVVSGIKGAPYVPMKRGLVKELLAFGELSSSDIFYDLGCGNGQVLMSAARDFHVSKAIGYEAAPWPFLLARRAIRRTGFSSVTIVRRDLLTADVQEAAFVYGYLFPKLVDQLASKLEKELRSGAKVLLPSFPIDLENHPTFSLKKEAKIGTITAYLYVKK